MCLAKQEQRNMVLGLLNIPTLNVNATTIMKPKPRDF